MTGFLKITNQQTLLLEAIRELIVNAVMHRNYLAHSNIQ